VELVAICDRTPETVVKAIFTRWICQWSTDWNHHQPRERILQLSHGQVVQGNETESRIRVSVSHILFPRDNGK
jgi:hypothetical protein